MRKSLALIPLLVSFACDADTIYDAIQYSMITNPEVLSNTARALAARQGMDRAGGAYYPSVDMTAGYGREETQNPTTTAIDDVQKQRLWRREFNVEARQNVFAGGGILNEYKRNQYLYEAQQLKTQGIAEDLALEVTQRYLNVILQEKLYALAVRNLEAHQRVFGMIKERSDAGIARLAELDQARSRLALAKANRISADANLREARISYARTVGRWPNNLKWPKVPTKAEMPKNLKDAIQKGLDNHPTVRSTYADIKEAKAQNNVAKAPFMPRVDFVLSAGRNKNLAGLVGDNNNNIATLRMTYNMFRGGSDLAAVRESAYQVQESYEVKNRALLDLKESLRLSWNAWVASGLRLLPLKEHVTAARQTRSAYEEQFKVGKRTLLDLLDSQNEYYQAQIEYARGFNDEVFSRFRIVNGMGGLLPWLNIRLPENVVNNDIFTSAQTHVLLNEPMEDIPYPDDTDEALFLARPVDSLETAKLTKAILNKNTAKPEPVKPSNWYVRGGCFKHEEGAYRLVARLKQLGFPAFKQYDKDKEMHVVYVGGYEYRGHAANTMTRMKEVAHVQGVLVTFNPHKS